MPLILPFLWGSNQRVIYTQKLVLRLENKTILEARQSPNGVCGLDMNPK